MPLIIGQRLQNRYSIVKQLGQGGMGAVYLAEDIPSGGQRVAIKEQIPDPHADPQTLIQLRQQFQVEAQILQNLNHPNLPKVFAYFSEGGNEYIVMEYIEGDNLQELLQKQGGPLPEKPVLFWADQLLDALGYLHSQPHPIIHRDIKPANIIVTRLGEIKLVDFGLVKLLDASNPLTGTVIKGMGTPEYTPLEQYGRGSLHTDGRSDIYALGATLYHLLTGVAPPDAPQRLMDPTQLHSPRTYTPALSTRAESAIGKAMAMQPHDRYPSAQAFRAALIGTQPVVAPPTVSISQAVGGYPPHQPARRDTRGAILLVGMVVLALLLLAIFPTVRNMVPGLAPTATTIVAVAHLTTPTTAPPTELASTITPTTATPEESGSLTTPTTDAPAPIVCTSDAKTEQLTIPDGTVVSPGTAFVKTWRIQNTGTCDWSNSYALRFVGGNQFDAPNEPIPAASSGEEGTISLSMVAPTEPGTYQGIWQLQDADGQPFGELLSVVINVQETPSVEGSTAINPPTQIPPASNEPLCTPDLLYVADVTIQDGTEIQKGNTFVKTWRVRNSGTCDWDSSYALLFVDGHLLGSPSAKVPALKPGEEANISLDLVAPTTPGTYRATWQLHAQGKAVGEFLNVVITVSPPPTNTPVQQTATSSPIPPVAPRDLGDGERIAFVSKRDGNNEIYLMNPDGTGLSRLTNNSADDQQPAWSPDGRLAFVSTRDGNAEIYLTNASGTGLSRLTNHSGDDWVPTWSPDGQQIAFVSERDGNEEIYLMNADGSGVRRLTDNPAEDGVPAWSPDGQRLAFVSKREGNFEIYLMNVDGTGLARLTFNSIYDGMPTWSPDGQRIAFISNRDGDQEIYLMNPDGSSVKPLTNNAVIEWRVAWSPDGTRITFESWRDGNGEIYLMNADGTNQTRLTNSSANDYWPAWSSPLGQQPVVIEPPTASPVVPAPVTATPVPPVIPTSSGERIAFVSKRDGNNEIYLMNPDGTGRTRLTNHPADDQQPAWSANGRLAFVSERDGNHEIYLMNADGTGPTRLTSHPANDWVPTWSPDGQQIAFVSERDGNEEIYLMNADGTGLLRLTDNPAVDGLPTWSPDGQRIAFISERDGNGELYLMNHDGTDIRRLTSHSAYDGMPAWSPDGQHIAFISKRDGNLEIYLMNADGEQQTRLTNNSAIEWRVVWSPDGTRMAFESWRDGNGEIYLMNADGTNLSRLTNHSANDYWPAWSSP